MKLILFQVILEIFKPFKNISIENMLINYYNPSLHFLCLSIFISWNGVSTGPKYGHTHGFTWGQRNALCFPFPVILPTVCLSEHPGVFFCFPGTFCPSLKVPAAGTGVSGLRWHRFCTDQRGVKEGTRETSALEEPVFCVGFHTWDFTSQLGWLSAWRSLFNSKVKISQWGWGGLCQPCCGSSRAEWGSGEHTALWQEPHWTWSPS